jgi:hypothetical protein
MKANPRDRATVKILSPIAALTTALLAGCVAPPPTAPAPVRTHTPAPPRPAPPPPPIADWRDAPVTPGTWSYGPGTSASFGGGVLGLRCDVQTRSVTLVRTPGPLNARGAVPISITTSTGARVLSGVATPSGVEVTLPARDPLLDAIAFSRGRFAVAVPATATLYVPSWTEISRVIEDCR